MPYLNPLTRSISTRRSAGKLRPAFDPAAARKLLDDSRVEAVASDGVREKDGLRALVHCCMASSDAPLEQRHDARRSRPICKPHRHRHATCSCWDATVAWGKLATQEFDAFTMSYPYLSATDALNAVLPVSANTPDAQPHELGRTPTPTNGWLGARTAIDPKPNAPS